MNLSYDYYLLANTHYEYPEWIKSERYFYCDNFMNLFPFFKRRKK